MNIEEIRRELTRKEFEKELENNEYGRLNETYSCPDDIGLVESIKCKYNNRITNNCKECWLAAMKNVVFKGEQKTYKGWEILKMIDDGILNEGDKYIRFKTANSNGDIIPESTFTIGKREAMPSSISFIEDGFAIKVK